MTITSGLHQTTQPPIILASHQLKKHTAKE